MGGIRSSQLFEENQFYNDDDFEFDRVSEKKESYYRFVLGGDSESLHSGHSNSRLTKKGHLEMLLQKANSISGIRKMNMQFKQERRLTDAFYQKDSTKSPSIIRRSYWDICEQFLELMEIKRAANLQTLTSQQQTDKLLDDIRTEVDYDVHCAVGLGRRMPMPPLDFETAYALKQRIYNRVV